MNHPLIPAQLEYGSFRDPEGFIISVDNQIFRAVSNGGFQVLAEFEQSGLKKTLEDSNDLIQTDLRPNKPSIISFLQNRFPTFEHFIEHKPVPYICYPYEWSYSMLCDAALLQLDLQIKLRQKGFSLKDATGFNIQFVHSKPIFIDWLSIEKITENYWSSYGQYCKMFLFPLFLSRYRNINPKSYFLPDVEGVPVEAVVKSLGFFNSIRPSAFIDIYLQYLFQKKSIKTPTHELKQKLSESHHKADIQSFLLNRLHRLVTNLWKSRQNQHSQWMDYARNNTYTPETKENKVRFVEEFLRKEKPHSVLDVGCNTGEYSQLAAKYCNFVLAVDADHDCIDELYILSRQSKLPIQTMWMDIANPTPAIGFNCAERKSFSERVKCDAVFALALIHHLLVSCGARPSVIRDCLFALTKKYLVVEYIHPSDSQFLSLIGLRKKDYSFFTEDFFRSYFSEWATLERSIKLGPTRTLFLFVKKYK